MLKYRVISEASFSFVSIRVYGFMSIERAFQIQRFYSFIFRLRLYLKAA